MKALVSTIEPRESGYRVAEVSQSEFPVAPDFFWVDCDDDVLADQFWYDPQDEQLKPMPQPEDIPIADGHGGLPVEGAQDL